MLAHSGVVLALVDGSCAHGVDDMMEVDTLLQWTCSLSWRDQPSTMGQHVGLLHMWLMVMD